MTLRDLTYYVSSLWDMIGVQVLDQDNNLEPVDGFCSISEFEDFAADSDLSDMRVINIIPGSSYNSIVLVVRGE